MRGYEGDEPDNTEAWENLVDQWVEWQEDGMERLIKDLEEDLGRQREEWKEEDWENNDGIIDGLMNAAWDELRGLAGENDEAEDWIRTQLHEEIKRVYNIEAERRGWSKWESPSNLTDEDIEHYLNNLTEEEDAQLSDDYQRAFFNIKDGLDEEIATGKGDRIPESPEGLLTHIDSMWLPRFQSERTVLSYQGHRIDVDEFDFGGHKKPGVDVYVDGQKFLDDVLRNTPTGWLKMTIEYIESIGDEMEDDDLSDAQDAGSPFNDVEEDVKMVGSSSGVTGGHEQRPADPNALDNIEFPSR
jgi:hypothetical protein